MKIHHNTLKKARANGIVLTVEDNEIVASKGDVRLASHVSGTVALQTALDKLGDANPGIKQSRDHIQAQRRAKAAKVPKAKAERKPKKQSAAEIAARAEGWTGKGGAFKNAEQESDSDAASWKDLCAEQEIEVEGDEEGKSIVKHKYRKLYRPNHNTNGDELAQLMREHLEYVDESDETKIDADLLKRFAQANECWVPAYSKLNVGQQRMNVGNRLRAKVRKDPDYKIKWAK